MMSESGQWETKLGRLGVFLTGQDARHLEIFNREAFVTVGWEAVDATRKEACFSPEELARDWAPYKHPPGSTSRSSLLGALGHELDQARLDPASIVEEHDGFVVTGSIRGRYESLRFSYSELGQEPGSADDDVTQPFMAPTQSKSPLRARLHLST